MTKRLSDRELAEMVPEALVILQGGDPSLPEDQRRGHPAATALELSNQIYGEQRKYGPVNPTQLRTVLGVLAASGRLRSFEVSVPATDRRGRPVRSGRHITEVMYQLTADPREVKVNFH